MQWNKKWQYQSIVECVCVCVEDGWLKQPHLARVCLIGVGLGEAAYLLHLEQTEVKQVKPAWTGAHGAPGTMCRYLQTWQLIGFNTHTLHLKEPSIATIGAFLMVCFTGWCKGTVCNGAIIFSRTMTLLVGVD